MIANRNFGQTEPLTWFGRFPVYLATALAIALAAGMVLTALAMAAGYEGWVKGTFAFMPLTALKEFKVWQFVTYAFVTPPDIMSAIQIILMAMFGRDVEILIGRRSFAWLFGLLVLTGPVALSLLNLVGFPFSDFFFGSGGVSFAVFIAFALMYPSAEIFFSVQARWFAIGLLALNTLILLAGHGWSQLITMWATCFAAAIWLGYEGIGPLRYPSLGTYLRQARSRSKLRVVHEEETEDGGSVHDSIDPILEKIARRGIGSLTKAERTRLEKARTALLEKERTNT